MSDADHRDWCKRCGGPVFDQRCANCATLEDRRRLQREAFGHMKDGLAEAVELLETVPLRASWSDPIDALLDALLPELGEHRYEIHLILEKRPRIELVRGELREAVLELPTIVAMECVSRLEVLRAMIASRGTPLIQRSTDGASTFELEISGNTHLVIRRIRLS